MYMGPSFFLGLLGMQAIAWVLLIAGVSAVQAHCHSRGYTKYATFGYFGPGSCSRMFGMAWWTVWYQFFMILGVMAAFATGLARWRLLVLTLMAPLISLMMETANSFLFMIADEGDTGSNLAQPRVVCAGSVLLCIAECAELGGETRGGGGRRKAENRVGGSGRQRRGDLRCGTCAEEMARRGGRGRRVPLWARNGTTVATSEGRRGRRTRPTASCARG